MPRVRKVFELATVLTLTSQDHRLATLLWGVTQSVISFDSRLLRPPTLDTRIVVELRYGLS